MIGALRNGAQGNRRRRIPAAVAVLAAATAAVLLIGASAHAAGVLDGKATAHLHLVQVEGSELDEAGPVVGVLSGTARGELHLGAVFKASFTIKTPSGSITGEGTAIPGVAHTYQNFEGSFTVTRGSGRYAHIHGRPQHLKGVLDRHTDSVVIETTGRLSY